MAVFLWTFPFFISSKRKMEDWRIDCVCILSISVCVTTSGHRWWPTHRKGWRVWKRTEREREWLVAKDSIRQITRRTDKRTSWSTRVKWCENGIYLKEAQDVSHHDGLGRETGTDHARDRLVRNVTRRLAGFALVFGRVLHPKQHKYTTTSINKQVTNKWNLL